MPRPTSEQMDAWRRRSKRIPPRSTRVEADLPRRADVRAAVFERDGGCVLRRLDGSHACFGVLTVHHLRKASAGGRYVESNLVACCASGNTAIEDRPTWARSLGLVVR